MAKRRRLGEVLHQRGHVSEEDSNQALQEQRGKLIHLGELLLQRGTVSKPDLISALGEVTTLAYIDCTAVQVSAEVLKTIPAEIARRHAVLPAKVHNGKLTVAMAEPQNLRLIDELRFKTGRKSCRGLVSRNYDKPRALPHRQCAASMPQMRPQNKVAKNLRTARRRPARLSSQVCEESRSGNNHSIMLNMKLRHRSV